MKRIVEDFLGRRFGRLVAIKDVGKHKGRYAWLCKCDCGNEKIITAHGLKDSPPRKGTKSCGCLHKDTIREKFQKPQGEVAFNQLLNNYKASAKKRGLLFAITKAEFAVFTKENCYYCGRPPHKYFSQHKYGDNYIYNGIDRVDNTKGYLKENCVPCCGERNFAKGRNTQKQFFDIIKMVYENLFI